MKRRYYWVMFVLLFGAAVWGLFEALSQHLPMPVPASPTPLPPEVPAPPTSVTNGTNNLTSPPQ